MQKVCHDHVIITYVCAGERVQRGVPQWSRVQVRRQQDVYDMFSVQEPCGMADGHLSDETNVNVIFMGTFKRFGLSLGRVRPQLLPQPSCRDDSESIGSGKETPSCKDDPLS